MMTNDEGGGGKKRGVKNAQNLMTSYVNDPLAIISIDIRVQGAILIRFSSRLVSKLIS